MSDEQRVTHWLEADSDANPDVRAVLGSAKADGLSAAQVEALSAKVLALAAATSTAASIAPAASSAGLSVASKATIAALVIGLAGGGLWTLRATPDRTTSDVGASRGARVAPSRVDPAPSPTVVPIAAQLDASAAPTVVAARTIATSQGATRQPRVSDSSRQGPIVARANTESPSSPTVAAIAAVAVDPADDVALLHRAAGALRSGAHRDALALLSRHREQFASSALSEERERIMIEALVRADRRAEAEREAGRFRARFPGSAQQRRIDALVTQDASVGRLLHKG